MPRDGTIAVHLDGCRGDVGSLAALFFLRFWVCTRDRFFLFFAIAFAIYAVSQLGLGLINISEFEPLYYLPRVLTISLIALAVLSAWLPTLAALVHYSSTMRFGVTQAMLTGRLEDPHRVDPRGSRSFVPKVATARALRRAKALPAN